MKHLSYFEVIPKNYHRKRVTVADQVKFVRVAILPEQIEEFDLPTRPVKKPILEPMDGKAIASRSTP